MHPNFRGRTDLMTSSDVIWSSMVLILVSMNRGGPYLYTSSKYRVTGVPYSKLREGVATRRTCYKNTSGGWGLIKQWGKLWGAKWPDEENGKLDPWWRNGTLIWGALWWRNGQIRDPSDDEIGAPAWWPDGEIGNPRPLILFKWFNTTLLHSFKRMGPKF